jgi:IMP dehydrogenase/GMP reductase
MFEISQPPVKKMDKDGRIKEQLKQALNASESQICYQICEELNLFENKTGFKVKDIIVGFTDSVDESVGSDEDKDVSVKIVLDTKNFE